MRAFAMKLYMELKEKQDVQNIVNLIKSNKNLSVDEQLQIVELLRQIHTEKNIGLFEDVSAFLALVNQVEMQLKTQNSTKAEGK